MSRQAFTTCSPLAVDCVLYQESGLINLWGAGVYYDGGTCWVVNSSGVITGTTTCEVGYDFYYADDYSCVDPCSQTATDQVVCFPAGSSVTNNKFYFYSGGGNAYLITGTTINPGGTVPLLDPSNGPFDTCTLACSVS